MQRQILGWLAILMLAGCAGPDDPLKKDLAAFQGEWALVLLNGVELQRAIASKANMTIIDSRWTRSDGGPESTFTLDPSKTPKAIDLFETEKKVKRMGIYRIEGDTLTICGADGKSEDRPTEFTAGPNRVLMEFRRAKK